MMSTIKKNWVYIIFAFSVLFFIATKLWREKEQKDKVQIELRTFENAWGWGYDILTNNKIYIHQEIIPAADGKKGFISKEQAETIGNLVITKMKKNQLPNVSLRELDSCKITR